MVERSDRDGEVRYIGVGYMWDRLHYVVFTDRGEATRIISLRRASTGERKRYDSGNRLKSLLRAKRLSRRLRRSTGRRLQLTLGLPETRTPLNWMKDWFRRARPAAEVVPHIVERWHRTRGKQKAPTKQSISIRLDADILAYYRASGRGMAGPHQ